MPQNDNNEPPRIVVTDQPASSPEEGEEHLFEKLFEAIKDGMDSVDDLSIGELLAAQCLIVNGISQTLGQIAQVQMSQRAEGNFTDIKVQMAIGELQKHLFALDEKLTILTEAIDGKLG